MIYALGAFDGFHLGHQSLLAKACERGEKQGDGWGVLTFENHPRALFSDKFKSLFTSDERDIMAAYLGVRTIVKLPFDRMLAEMSPESFADFLRIHDGVSGLVVGQNFRFGKARTGTLEVLAEICVARKWSLDVLSSLAIDGQTVSSTAVRDFVLRGQLENAVRFLGYPFLVSGKVVKGDGRGRTLGFATANLVVNNKKVYPAKGSYAAFSYIDGKWFPVALNIGFNPTFDLARRLRCEAHIIGFSGDLYGRKLHIFTFAKNRDEIKFESENTLKKQLAVDVSSICNTAQHFMDSDKEFLQRIKAFL